MVALQCPLSRCVTVAITCIDNTSYTVRASTQAACRCPDLLLTLAVYDGVMSATVPIHRSLDFITYIHLNIKPSLHPLSPLRIC